MDGKEKKRIGRTCSRKEAERLVNISRDNVNTGRRSPGRPKRRWSDLIPV